MTEPPTLLTKDLHDVLELEAEKKRLQTRLDLIRGRLSEAFIEEFRRTNAAPTWKLPKLGQVRLDGINGEPAPYVSDEAEFANWLAQRYPTEVVANIVLADTTQLDDALAALEFAGVSTSQATVTPRPTAAKMVFNAVELVAQHDEDAPPEDHAWMVVDSDGEVIPGASARASSEPRLVVAVDTQLKADMVAQAELEDHDNISDVDVSETEQEGA